MRIKRKMGSPDAYELNELAFEGSPLDARVLGAQWHRMLAEAQAIVEVLPPDQTGAAVLDRAGNFYRQPPDALSADLQDRAVFFHGGRIRGVWPVIASVRQAPDR
jgi:hypothetical protein